MSGVTEILSAIEQGDPSAADQLLPLVYDGLRKLAVQKMGQERPGQTLQATALVHEAYLQLVDIDRCAYQLFRPSCVVRAYVVGDRELNWSHTNRFSTCRNFGAQRRPSLSLARAG